MTNAERVVGRFVEAINDADLGRLSSLMTDDHVFVDSDGSRLTGRATVLGAWSQFFRMVADYRVIVAETYGESDTTVMIGSAEGRAFGRPKGLQSAQWSVPAAWRAMVEGERVALWQVFVNPEPIVAALREAHNGGS